MICLNYNTHVVAQNDNLAFTFPFSGSVLYSNVVIYVDIKILQVGAS